MSSLPPAPKATSSQIVFLAGLAIIAIACYQTVSDGRPDQYTIGALLALALGGGVGRVADQAIKGYVAGQVKAAQDSLRDEFPLPPAAPPGAAAPAPPPSDVPGA